VKIRRLYLDGFGPFADREFGGLSAGLNVLSGPNEAGKSALRAFIRAVLFGFITRRASAEERAAYEYPPMAGGVEGGLIELEGEDGAVFTVERYRRKAAPATGEIQVVRNGVIGGQGMLDELLHPVGARVYQNVYSIALGELSGLDSEIQARIAAAGLGSTGDVLGVKGRLGTELNSLHRELGTARTKSREARSEYEAAQIELQSYGALVEQRQDIGQTVESVKEEIRRARERLTRLDMLGASRENWNRMQEVQRQMEGLPRLEFLPPHPVKRLDEAEERCRRVETLVREGDGQEEQRQREMESLAADLAPELCTQAVSHLIARQSEYRNAVQDVERVRAQAEENERRLQEGLGSLGRDWDRARLEAFDDSLETRSSLERLEETLARADGELDASVRAAEQAELDRVASTQAEEDAARSLAALGTPPEMTLEEMTGRRSALNRLRALAAERPDAQRDLDQAAQRLASAEGRRRSRLAMAVQFGVSAAVTAAGVVASVTSVRLGEPKVAQMGYLIAAVGGLGMLTSLAFLLWPSGRRRSDGEGDDSTTQTGGEPDNVSRA